MDDDAEDVLHVEGPRVAQLGLILAEDLEGDRLVRRELRATVQRGELEAAAAGVGNGDDVEVALTLLLDG